ncbi:MAG: hypothetical protein JJU06_21125 [Ectothiorhodospiraceae bacterium]|nr:hypothetical protein [Ectothiorhodospiraceae bacterium]MCH8503213.1 hypothetical protein [Ectothiorhodospiraceae bacterium]
MSERDAYWQALIALTDRYPRQVAERFRVRPGYLTAGALAIVVNYVAGDRLRAWHAQHGRLSAAELFEVLTALEPAQRHPRTAVDALAWYDRGASQSLRLPLVAAQVPLFQPGVERAFRGRRRHRTEHSLRQLITQVRAMTDWASALSRVATDPDVAEGVRRDYRRGLRDLRRRLRSAEWHARAGGGWAIKNAFPVSGVSRALHRLYLRPLWRLDRMLERVERCLAIPEGDRQYAGVERTSRRFGQELAEAATVDVRRARRATEVTGGRAPWRWPAVGAAPPPRSRPGH